MFHVKLRLPEAFKADQTISIVAFGYRRKRFGQDGI
ncbi:hypothetical protein GobsT_08740 [Gemmata obscuriglobus]|nr:hypothetical protein GobsT_08740 [Gemmata obscuriglobus]VTS00691.1 unnamed protein product [Gemmata obscuriglobus UQM 2246]